MLAVFVSRSAADSDVPGIAMLDDNPSFLGEKVREIDLDLGSSELSLAGLVVPGEASGARDTMARLALLVGDILVMDAWARRCVANRSDDVPWCQESIPKRCETPARRAVPTDLRCASLTHY